MSNLYISKEKYDSTTISASAYNRKVTVELPVDCNGHELLEAFRAVMIGLTYSPKSFDDVLVNYVIENELMEKHDSSSTDVSPFLQELTNGNTIRDLEKEIKTLRDHAPRPQGPPNRRIKEGKQPLNPPKQEVDRAEAATLEVLSAPAKTEFPPPERINECGC